MHFRGMKWFILLASLQLLPCAAPGRILRHGSSTGIDREPVLVSNGVRETPSWGLIAKPRSQTGLQRFLSSSSCDETYGFMPCSTTVLGNLVSMAAYRYMMFKSDTLITNGCELLVVVMGNGIIGGLLLPILGSFSDVVPIAVYGLSGSKATAQSQVLNGMGLLVGSIITLLTVLWGSATIIGKCDQDTKGFKLHGAGVTTGKATSECAQIMVVSLIPFIIVEISQFMDASSAEQVGVLVRCITAIICLLSYCIYEVLHSWIQNRRLAYAKQKHMISAIMKNVHSKGWGKLLREDGQPDQDVLKSVFGKLDDDSDGYLTKHELRGLLYGLELQDPDSSTTDAVNKVMADFDSSRDDKLSLDEFKVGMSSWLRIATSKVGPSISKNGPSISKNYSKKFISDFQAKAKEELEALQNEKEKKVVEVDNPCIVYLKAATLMLGGAILAGIFADPLVDAVDNFSDATSIPSFFISFIITPLATNSSEAVAAFTFASRKKKRTASLTYSQIYGAVTMNNTISLAMFLAAIYIRGLDWNFTAEVLVIVLVVLVMGLFKQLSYHFPPMDEFHCLHFLSSNFSHSLRSRLCNRMVIKRVLTNFA